MQNGPETGPADVKIEGEETYENIRKPVDPEAQLDEVTRSAGDRVGGDGATPGTEVEGDPDADQIEDDNDQAAPEDPEEAQSPT